MRAFVLATAMVLGWPMGLGVAEAQEDWGLTRERPSRPSRPQPGTDRPRRPRPDRAAPPARDRSEVLLARYMRVLEQSPTEGFAFERLLDLYRERDGNIDAFVRELEGRLSEDPDAYAPRMLLGHVLKAQGRMADARAAYEQAARIRPAAAAPLVALGEIARSANDPARARELYERALEHTREAQAKQELLRQLGQIALGQEEWEAARGYYDRVASGAQGSVYLLTEYARALTERNQHARAVAEYERVLRRLRGDNRVLPPVLREMADAQLEAGDTAQAIETLDRALRITGRSAGTRREIYDTLVEAYRRADRLPELAERLARERGGFETHELLGRIHDELGHEAEALAAYRRALATSRGHIDTRVRVIQLLSRSGRMEDVIAEYETLIRVAPREPRFVVELVQLLMQVGRREEALRRAEQTSRSNPREPAVHRALAEMYSRWGEDERAAREVAILARIEPNDPAHLVALGAQQLEAGERSQALATWRRILQVEGDRGRAHAALGGVLADHDMLDEAAREYREAVRLDPARIEHVRGLASVLERQRQEEEAVRWWHAVIELATDDRAARREARTRIVAIWDRSRQLAARVTELTRRFEGQPPDVEAGRFLAEAHRRRGPQHQADAERVLARIIELEPGDTESLLALERVRTAQGDLEGAIDALRRLVQADPRRAAGYLQRMAEHALALYRDEEAVRYAAQAVERTPDDAGGHRRLGDLYRVRQDMDRAIASYRRAIELDERLHPTHLDLAEVHLARGELQEADRLFRQVVRASPDDDLVSRAARASIQINLGADTLADLERDLLPLALGHPQRPVYRKLVVELYDALARPLIQQARGAGAAGREAQAELERLGARAIKPLLEALADSEPAQKRVAVEILGYLGNENAAAPLLAAAEGEGDTDLRVQALAAAGAVASPDLAPRFAALANGTERRLRGVATWGLARMGGRRSVAALRELLDEGDASVRAYAALGLGRARDRASAGELETLLRTDRSVHVQAAAAWALGRLGEPSRVPALVAALRGRGGIVALASAHALGRIGDPSARDALASALFDEDPAQQEASARALRRIGGGDGGGADEPLPVPSGTFSAGEYLMRLLAVHDRDGDDPVALAPHRAALTQAARDALHGPPERVLAGLGVLAAAPGAHLGLGPLTSRMDRWAPEDREATFEELDALARALLPDLLAVARHADPDIRAESLRLLARISHPDAVGAIVDALEDRERSVQRAALESLTGPGGPVGDRAVASVARILGSHPDWWVRTAAAETLGRMALPAGRGPLALALREDSYAFVREAAARALGALGGGEQALRQAAEADTEPRVREAARRALSARD